MFLIMLIEAATIIGSILITLFTVKKGFKMSLETGASNMLGASSDGGKKAEKLNKPPLNNPNTAGGNNQNGGAGAGTGTGVGYQQQPALPDMKGADYGSYAGMPDMASGISGGGAIGVVVTGLVNGIGAVVQGGNVSNMAVAGKHVIKGPVIQGGGLIYNNKLSGAKRLSQSASAGIINNTRGRTKMNQGGPNKIAISSGRVRIAQNGLAQSYISGPVARIRNGKIENLRLRAPLKVQKLMVRKLTANKETSNKMKQLSGRGLTQGKYIGVNVNVNDINLKRNETLEKTNLAVKTQNNSKTVERQNLLGGPSNLVLGGTSSVGFASSGSISGNGGGIDTKAFQNILKKTLVLLPNFSPEEAMRTANLAAMIANEKSKNKLNEAHKIADQNIESENAAQRKVLDDILKDPSSQAGFRYQKMVEETMKETNSISDERMKEIEKEAWETVQARKDIPLEQKEEEYEKLKAKKIEEEGGTSQDDVEEIIKDRIINSPEIAKAIIGEDGAKKLEEALNKNKDEKEKVVAQELIKQDVEEHKEYLKANPQARKKSYYDAYKERREKEMNQNIIVAASQLYANKDGGFDKQKYAQLMQENNVALNQDQPQPTGSSQIFIARGAQDRSATEEV